MAKLESKLDEIIERKQKSGQYKVVDSSELYPIYHEINEEMKNFNESQKKQEKISVEYASKLILQ